MIHSLSGKLIAKKPNFASIEVNGIGFKAFICFRTFRELPKIGSKIKLLTYLSITQNGAEIYGFLGEKELEFFELLISVNGIGPKAALKVLDVMKIDNLMAAVSKGRTDLLTKAAGIGTKKAQRIILELNGKIKHNRTEDEIFEMESNIKLEQVLKSLGYKQKEIQEAIKHIPAKINTVEGRLKEALKILGS